MSSTVSSVPLKQQPPLSELLSSSSETPCAVALSPAIRATTGPLILSLLQLLVKSIQLEDGKMIPASHFFRGEDSSALELTEAELVTMEAVRVGDRFGDTVRSSRLHTARVLHELHSLESGVCTLCGYMCWPQHSVCSVLSWAFLYLLDPSATTGTLRFDQLGLTLSETHCQQWTNETETPGIAERVRHQAHGPLIEHVHWNLPERLPKREHPTMF